MLHTLREPRHSGAISVPLLLLGGVVVAAVILLVAYQVHLGSLEHTPGGGDEFSYDLKELLHVDPALIVYEEVQTLDTGLQEPRGLATGPVNDVLFVVGDRALRTFSPDGNRLSELSFEEEPRCLDVTSGGQYYLGFRDHVEVYDSKTQGRSARWPGLGERAMLTSLAVSGSDTYVADAGQRVIWRCDVSGQPTAEIGRKDPERDIPGLFVPSPYMDLAMASDGLLRVVNPGRHRIEAYTRNGDLEFYWGKRSNTAIEGFSGCCNPCNFALLPAGGFVTAEKGLPRVKLYDERGAFVGVVAAPASFAEGERALRQDWRKGSAGGLDVAVDSKGRVLVLDPLGRSVHVFVKKKA